MGLEGGGDGEDVGAGFGEGDGHGHADAALGAGDEGGFSVEFELVQDHCCVTPGVEWRDLTTKAPRHQEVMC